MPKKIVQFVEQLNLPSVCVLASFCDLLRSASKTTQKL